MILTRLTRWALRTAARRWPDGMREELLREWQAELTHLEQRPGTAGRRLGFALSLLTSPPVRDAAGVPRGWAEARSGLSPAVILMLAAIVGLGLTEAGQSYWFTLFSTFGDDSYGWWLRGTAIADAVVLTLWAVPIGFWLGRAQPMARDGRLGTAGPAVLAPLAMVPALVLPGISGDMRLTPTMETVLGVLAWTALSMVLGRAAVRAGRTRAVLLALAGVPLVATCAAALATVPLLITQGRDAAVASLILSGSSGIQPDAQGWIIQTGVMIGPFLAFGWLAAVYGLRAAAAPERPIRATTAADSPVRPAVASGSPLPVSGEAVAPEERAWPALPAVVPGAGLVAVLAGVLAWAYTVAYLTPAILVMAATAPMPGGDGEIFLWIAELRWTAILLTVLGAVIATAGRRSMPRAAILLAVGLFAAESVLLSHRILGAGGFRIALLTAAVLITAAWALAGPALPGIAAGVDRSRTAAAAIAAVGLGPLLYFQNTPPENHEFMPLGLPVTTVGVAAGLVLLGMITAAATSPRRPHPLVIALLVVVPIGLLVGLGVYFGNGASESFAGAGIALGLPLAVLVTALVRRHRPRRRGRTALLWSSLAVAAVPATIVLLYAAIMLLAFVPEILFKIDGTSYPADGLSVVPGAALLVLPAAVWLAGRPGGAPTTAPGPQPDSGPEPQLIA
ncbi:hypothetical protein [Actinoplanes derwentensis]|uniref:Uncharacterized protein n=1 Tax=Actinoplanes derwentensis TaxID=113562 RepID=A0A1H2DF14_9ACTN|nr:hypothetical protein [Actinoplanes derwentensis]SDT81323.1 hypothetical protein SAMN04489716_9585 [Actinoplanes derwentensis]